MNETKFLNWVKDLPDSFDMDVADIHFTCEDEFEGMLVEVYFDGKIRFKYEGYFDKTYFPLHSVRISHDWGEAECTTEVIVDNILHIHCYECIDGSCIYAFKYRG